MYKNKLELYQKCTESIWTDEHICKTLLKTQLDDSTNAASRKSENRTKIINWINKNVKSNSSIIDFGCGPGLYSYDLGKLGHNVLGIDFNKASYDYANKNKSIKNFVEYKYCNYIKDKITGKYNVALMIYCDFSALIPSNQISFLKKLTALLKDDGIFIFDIFGLSVMKNISEKLIWTVSQGNDFWNKNPYFLLEEVKKFEKENTVGTRYYLIDQITGKIKEFIMWDLYYNNNLITKFMLENGFEVLEINKDIANYKEETLFVIARKINKKAKTST